MSEKQGLSKREETKPVPATTVRPPVDVVEDESGITLSADLPGLAKDKLQVRVDGDTLMVEAKRVSTYLQARNRSTPRSRRCSSTGAASH